MDYSIFNTLLDVVLVVDEEKNVVYANEPAANLCGVSAKRLQKGVPLVSLITTEPQFLPASMGDVTEPTAYAEVRFTTQGSMTGYLQVTIQPAFTNSTQPKHWVIFGRDISLEVTLQSKYRLESSEKREALAKVERSRFDPLTGIFHKGVFIEKYGAAFADSIVNQTPLCLCVFDLDNFKKVNDTYGHKAGDLVLQEVVKVVKDTIRGADFFARYGGEEFVIIFEATPLEKAAFVCERIRQNVEQLKVFYSNHVLGVTLSIGVGQLDESFNTTDSFFEWVDQASYHSKKIGKNKVTIAKK